MTQGVRIPDGFVDELKARVRPSDVIGRKVKLKKQGKEWVGLSPFTSEKSPSFYVNDQKRIFKCFSSGIGGDVISFVMETERLSFMEAVEKLAEEVGMELPKASEAAVEAYDRRKRLQEACEAAAVYFQDRLQATEGAEARAYLEGRGLTRAAWARHRLGYSPDDWRTTSEHLKSIGFTAEEILEAGLTKTSDKGGEPYDAFRGRIMFPITDTRGHVIAFGGRGMTADAKPKYLNSGDTPLFQKSHILYRYKAAREALGHGEGGGLIVCEGYMDAIALTEAGFGTAVAPLGTALTEEQLSLLWRAGPEPLLCFDGDSAGLRAAYRAIDRAMPHVEPGRSLYFALLPEGMDPDDLIRERGINAMAEALSSALPLSEMLWQREVQAEDIDTPERQAGLEARLLAAAEQVKHQGVRSAYERDLRARLKDYLWEARRAKRNDSYSNARSNSPSKGQNSRPSGAPATILKSGAPAKIRGLGSIVFAVDHPSLISLGGEELAECHFPDPDVCAIRDGLLDLADTAKMVDREALSTHLLAIGNMRAAKLLNEYPHTPDIIDDGPEAREWLIALEQYVDVGTRDGGTKAASGEATASPAALRSLHRRIAERQALKVRMSEAGEKK